MEILISCFRARSTTTTKANNSFSLFLSPYSSIVSPTRKFRPSAATECSCPSPASKLTSSLATKRARCSSTVTAVVHKHLGKRSLSSSILPNVSHRIPIILGTKSAPRLPSECLLFTYPFSTEAHTHYMYMTLLPRTFPRSSPSHGSSLGPLCNKRDPYPTTPTLLP